MEALQVVAFRLSRYSTSLSRNNVLGILRAHVKRHGTSYYSIIIFIHPTLYAMHCPAFSRAPCRRFRLRRRAVADLATKIQSVNARPSLSMCTKPSRPYQRGGSCIPRKDVNLDVAFGSSDAGVHYVTVQCMLGAGVGAHTYAHRITP